MRRVSLWGYITLCWICSVLSACTTTPAGFGPPQDLAPQVVISSRYCLPAAKNWRATWIASSAELTRMLARCPTDRITRTPTRAPSVDFTQYRVLAVEMGEKSTLGHGFDVRKIKATLQEDTVVVTLSVRRPPPGAATAQMVISPCLLIRLPIGAYHHLTVRDQDGILLTRLDLP